MTIDITYPAEIMDDEIFFISKDLVGLMKLILFLVQVVLGINSSKNTNYQTLEFLKIIFLER